jgi:DUF438 domain-containing protein
MSLSQVDLKKLLDEIPIALTYVDSGGTILYRNRAAAERPSPRPRDVGTNIQDCHARPESAKGIERIFNDFINGRKKPHHYVSDRLGFKELVMLIPIFKENRFEGCLSVIHPLEIKGETRTF